MTTFRKFHLFVAMTSLLGLCLSDSATAGSVNTPVNIEPLVACKDASGRAGVQVFTYYGRYNVFNPLRTTKISRCMSPLLTPAMRATAGAIWLMRDVNNPGINPIPSSPAGLSSNWVLDYSVPSTCTSGNPDPFVLTTVGPNPAVPAQVNIRMCYPIVGSLLNPLKVSRLRNELSKTVRSNFGFAPSILVRDSNGNIIL
jgi:hypothetical protein